VLKLRYIIVNKIVYKFEKPKRGDVIAFNYLLPDKKIVYVKRIVALSGDTIEVKRWNLYVNEKIVKEPYILEKMNYEFKVEKVPKNKVFVLGDNRNDNIDSRIFGAISTRSIIGKVIFIYEPIWKKIE
jgi:signal peptidase I